ncbi:sigma factor-like helix-turn-helix DNA-binding protein, partial [Escherichia coli]
LDGLTYSEIAHKLGCFHSSVKKYVAKAVEHCLLDGLNGKTREAFLLSQLDGLTYSEIAHKLGCFHSSVKKYVAKAVEHCLL